MDLKKITGAWTEEQHSAFLTWMEGSFVQRMPSRAVNADAADENGPGLRLDRVVPDSETESNRDHLEKRNKSSRYRDQEERKRCTQKKRRQEIDAVC